MATSSDSSPDDSLRQLCERLVALHFRAAVDVQVLAGERDVRLQVCREDRDDGVLVELLAPDPPTWRSRSWAAVRVEHGHREVWRGPDNGCPVNDVMGFVVSLLCLGVGQLGQLYLDLG